MEKIMAIQQENPNLNLVYSARTGLIYRLWSSSDIQRIKPPMYRIRRKHYNEYEVRQLMLDVAKGIAPKGIKVTCVKTKQVSYITETGLLTEPLPLFNISGDLAMDVLAIRTIKRRISKRIIEKNLIWK